MFGTMPVHTIPETQSPPPVSPCCCCCTRHQHLHHHAAALRVRRCTRSTAARFTSSMSATPPTSSTPRCPSVTLPASGTCGVCVCVFGVTGWARAEQQGAMAQWRCGSSTTVGWGQRGSTSPPCDGQAISRVPSGQPARLAGLPLLLAQPTPPYLPAIHQQRPLPGVGEGEGAARVKRQVGLRMRASVGVSTPAPAQAASGSEPCVHSHGEHPARLAARTPRACHLSTGPACCPPLHSSRSGAHRVRSSPAWCASGASAAGTHQGSHSPHCARCGSKRSGMSRGAHDPPRLTHLPPADLCPQALAGEVHVHLALRVYVVGTCEGGAGHASTQVQGSSGFVGQIEWGRSAQVKASREGRGESNVVGTHSSCSETAAEDAGAAVVPDTSRHGTPPSTAPGDGGGGGGAQQGERGGGHLPVLRPRSTVVRLMRKRPVRPARHARAPCASRSCREQRRHSLSQRPLPGQEQDPSPRPPASRAAPCHARHTAPPPAPVLSSQERMQRPAPPHTSLPPPPAPSAPASPGHPAQEPVGGTPRLPCPAHLLCRGRRNGLQLRHVRQRFPEPLPPRAQLLWRCHS